MTGSLTRAIALIALVLHFLWPRYLFFQVAGKGVSGFTLVAMALLAAALASFVIRHRFRQNVLAGVLRSKLLIVIVAAWWLWRLLCDMIVGTDQAAFTTFLDFLYLGSWFISGAIIFADYRIRAALPYAIAFCVLAATVFGVIEYQTGTPIARLLGLANQSQALNQFTAELSRGGAMRVRSLFSHPIVYGQMMAALIPFALYFVVAGRIGGKVLGILMLAGIALSLVLCNARSPFIVAAIAIACFFATYLFDLRRPARLFLAVIGLASAVIATPIVLAALTELQSGRTSEEAGSTTARNIQMDRGTTALRESPLMGFGTGSAGEYASTKASGGVSIDNYYLTAAVEGGYVGLSLLLLMLIAMGRQGLRAIYATPENRPRTLNCAAFASIVGLASGLTVISITDTLSLVFLLAGFLAAASGVPAIARRARKARMAAAAEPEPAAA